MKRRGRKPKYVEAPDGQLVVGLHRDKSTGQYFTRTDDPNGKRPYVKKYFGGELVSAVRRFRLWQIEQNSSETKTLVPIPVGAVNGQRVQLAEPELPETVASIGELRELATQSYQYVDSEGLYKWARNELLRDPREFARRVGIPELATLTPGSVRSLSLDAVAESYFSKRRKLSKRWQWQQRVFWKAFRKAVGADTLLEIGPDDMQRYHKSVWDTYEKQKRSPVYVHHRLTAVRTILRHGLKIGNDQAELRRVLDLTQQFEFPRKNGADPQPIAPEHFAALLEACDAKWKAILLLSLNACLYPSEFAAVKKRHIDLKRGTLVMDRGKTGVPRVAVLWQRTIDAIKAYQQEQPHESAYVFTSQTGKPCVTRDIDRAFVIRRKRAGVPTAVVFSSIRDGGYTAAVEHGASVDQARLLAGHRIPGVTDYYLKRNPRMVNEACTAIEKHYFAS